MGRAAGWIGGADRVGGLQCIASGLLFRNATEPEEPLSHTLPVRLFLCTLFGGALLFAISWYLDVYYVPLLWRDQP